MVAMRKIRRADSLTDCFISCLLSPNLRSLLLPASSGSDPGSGSLRGQHLLIHFARALRGINGVLVCCLSAGEFQSFSASINSTLRSIHLMKERASSAERVGVEPRFRYIAPECA